MALSRVLGHFLGQLREIGAAFTCFRISSAVLDVASFFRGLEQDVVARICSGVW